MALTPFNEWPEVYNDSELEIRRNPQDPQEQGLIPTYLKKEKSFNVLIMPRGTLPEIAKGNREHGKSVLETLANDLLPSNWMEIIKDQKRTLELFGTRGYTFLRNINTDSLLSAIKTAYISEQEKYKDWKDSRTSED